MSEHCFQFFFIQTCLSSSVVVPLLLLKGFICACISMTSGSIGIGIWAWVVYRGLNTAHVLAHRKLSNCIHMKSSPGEIWSEHCRHSSSHWVLALLIPAFKDQLGATFCDLPIQWLQTGSLKSVTLKFFFFCWGSFNKSYK